MKLWKHLKTKMLRHGRQQISENELVMTYCEAVSFAEEFSKQLSHFKCCAILCDSEMAAGLALLSCFAAGVTAVPLSKRYGELHCQKILDTIGPDAVIIDSEGGLEVCYREEHSYNIPKVHPALIMCTSGTTGSPKGAMLTEKNIITNVMDISQYFNLNVSDSILIARPLYHCAVLTGEYLTSLMKGVRIHFYSGAFNPAQVLALIKEHKITSFCGTPTLLSMMARFKRNQLDELKHICVSGECMSFETGTAIADAFPEAEIYHIYGLTEACPRVSYLPPNLFQNHADCVGIPLKNVSLKIITDQGKLAQTNEIGVLWIKGPNVMAGYYNNLGKTSEVMQDGWLCTGDRALINEFGLLKIKGRNDDLIIKAGMNIYPLEIENALKVDQRVKELFVCSQNDNKYGVQIVLNIVGDFSSISEVKALCCKCLPAYQVPNVINLLDELPKNGSGKIIRRNPCA